MTSSVIYTVIQILSLTCNWSILINTLNFTQVKSMDDNCGEWVEYMGVASGCGEQEAGVASGSGWNLWVWLMGVVVRRYI